MTIANWLKRLRYFFKNGLDNPRRALTLFFALTGALALMQLADGFINWIVWAQAEGDTLNELGHIQVTKKDFYEKFLLTPNDFLIPPPNVDEIKNLSPLVFGVSQEVYTNGLASTGEQTVPFKGIGYSPDVLNELIVLKDAPSEIMFPSKRPDDIALGEGLAHNLKIKAGASVILLGTSAEDSQSAIESKVASVFHTANIAFDELALKTPTKNIQSLLKTDQIHKWVIYFKDFNDTDLVLPKLREYLQDKYPDLIATPWYERAFFYQKAKRLFSKQLFLFKFLLALIMILGFSNLFAMNVFDRTREIGTLRALGFRRSDVFKQFFTEGIIWGLLGGFLATLIGFGVCAIISWVGIPMPPTPGMAHGFTARLLIGPQEFLFTWCFAFFTCLFANVFPAIKAARTNILSALGAKYA